MGTSPVIARQSARTRTLRYPWPHAKAAGAEARVCEALAGGAVMTYPTETAYALGGNALLPRVAEAVYRLKGRPRDKPLLLLIDGRGGLEGWARDVRPATRVLMARFWPGPLTLVLRAGAALPPHLADARGTVALRWSPHPLIAELLRLGGVPLIGTSANVSGAPDSATLPEVLASFPAGIALALDGGTAPRGLVSTVVDTTVRPYRVLREGAIAAADIRSTLAVMQRA